jgi:hypothetical protein
VFFAGTETDAGHEYPPCPLDLLENWYHVGNMIEKIIDPPNINVFGKLSHRKPYDIIGVMPIAKQTCTSAYSLKKRIWHGPSGNTQSFKGIYLFAYQINVY